ncbi:endolytic transglycosylase MltG [Candidatus Peregrinibacteria bacterium]|nr:endolytic transglycosylase MltG [Candidatus Peregrinibacteria bacterium]
MKKTVFLLSFSILFLLSLYGGFAFFFVSPGQRVLFEIPKGASATEIAESLEKNRLIQSSLLFKFYLKKQGLSEKIKAGRYIIPAKTRLADLADLLVSGKNAEMPITFPEGFTANEMALLLEQQGLTTHKTFLACLVNCAFSFNFLPSQSGLEGYLFPDTYFINIADYDNQTFINRMLRTFQKRLSAEDWKTISESSHSLEEIIKIASIVEAEESSETNRPIVAGILWKRFDHGIGLGADATIRYAIKKRTGALSKDDLATNSIYNTRKYRGLPPTAIGNPGISSIRAALYPVASDFLYYLHDSDGVIHYAKTLEEHNRNKALYL